MTWRLLAEQARIEDAMGLDQEATMHWSAVKARRSAIAARLPDPNQRAAFLSGPLASYLGLSR